VRAGADNDSSMITQFWNFLLNTVQELSAVIPDNGSLMILATSKGDDLRPNVVCVVPDNDSSMIPVVPAIGVIFAFLRITLTTGKNEGTVIRDSVIPEVSPYGGAPRSYAPLRVWGRGEYFLLSRGPWSE